MPEQLSAGCPVPGKPRRVEDRPVRDPDPARNAAYWARIDRIVDQAPPLTDEQKAIIRTAIWGTDTWRAATA